ncbi:MAG: hypothetical protein WC341_16650 [Bacteroidales bacterium]
MKNYEKRKNKPNKRRIVRRTPPSIEARFDRALMFMVGDKLGNDLSDWFVGKISPK